MTEKQDKIQQTVEYIKKVTLKLRQQDRDTVHKKVSSLLSMILEFGYLVDAITEDQKDEMLTKYEVSKHNLIQVIYDTPEEDLETTIRGYMRTTIFKVGIHLVKHGLLKIEDIFKA